MAALLVCAVSVAMARDDVRSSASASSTMKKLAKKYARSYARIYAEQYAQPGPRGLPGPAGAAGPQGPAGPPGVQQLTTVRANYTLGTQGSGNDIKIITAQCPAGMRAISGGGTVIAGDGDYWYDQSSITGWSAGGDNDSASLSADLEAVAYCSPGVGTAKVSARQQSQRYDSLIAARRAVDAPVEAAHSCSGGRRHAIIGGQHKCLQRGQFCAKRYARQYRRYGFRCVGGRLR